MRLFTRLAGLSGSDGATLKAPLADLTDAQVADLALDLDAPLDTLWWRGGRAESGGEAGEARLRWEAALAEANRDRGVLVEDSIGLRVR
ncbi:MAG TPA: hypothetical protein DEB06_10770 [Phycisphaerales bacterium]|nr:hypothetical protein [Phycisphaerales bacterium]